MNSSSTVVTDGSSTTPAAGRAGTPSFADLGVPARLTQALEPQGITSPTPIQAATLQDSLNGRDVLGRGRTGSGKTYAFLLPTVARLSAQQQRPAPRRPRSLILAPTRELALQIESSLLPLASVTGLSTTTVFGGVGQNPQVKALQRGVDVLVACPGRLLDLMGQGHIDLSGVEVLVIDEADHMADMGFLPMVRRIMDKVPGPAQKMLFSATLDAGVGVLVDKYLHSPVVHEADSAVSPVSTMDHHVLSVDGDAKMTTLADLCAAPGRTIVFTRTKYGAKKAARKLRQNGVAALELHGNLSQNARTRNLDAFHSGAVETLVATDIAARGIHVDDVALVVHADPPAEHKAYLHRSGRTARAGQAGTVITLAGSDQRDEVRQLMRAAKIKPTIHQDGTARAVLDQLAPGARTYLSAAQIDSAVEDSARQTQVSQAERSAVTSGQDDGGAPASSSRPRRGGGDGRRRSRGRGTGSSGGQGGPSGERRDAGTSSRGERPGRDDQARSSGRSGRRSDAGQGGSGPRGGSRGQRSGGQRSGESSGSGPRVYTSESGGRSGYTAGGEGAGSGRGGSGRTGSGRGGSGQGRSTGGGPSTGGRRTRGPRRAEG